MRRGQTLSLVLGFLSATTATSGALAEETVPRVCWEPAGNCTLEGDGECVAANDNEGPQICWCDDTAKHPTREPRCDVWLGLFEWQETCEKLVACSGPNEEKGDDCAADTDPSCNERSPECEPDDPECCGAQHVGGESIDLATGGVSFSSGRSDAAVAHPAGTLRLHRKYNSRIIFTDGRERVGISPPLNRSHGQGWYHRFEAHLLESSGYPLVLNHYRGNGSREWFSGDYDFTTLNGEFNPAVRVERGANNSNGNPGWVITEEDGDRLSFARLLESATVANNRGRLHCVEETNGAKLRVWYYQSGSDPNVQEPCGTTDTYQAEHCETSNADYQGKLCIIEESERGQYIYFDTYDSNGRLTELRSGRAAGSFSSASDVGTQMGDLHWSTAYFHSDVGDRVDTTRTAQPGFDDIRLSRVEYRYGSSNTIYDSEHYTYTGTAYERDDVTGSSYGALQDIYTYMASPPPIVLEHRHATLVSTWTDVSVSLLETVRDHGGVSSGSADPGKFVVGHAYTSEGWGALNAEPGNHFIVGYLAATMNSGKYERRVAVLNETSNEYAEFIVGELAADGGYRLLSSSDSCSGGCGTTGALQFSYDAGTGRVEQQTTEDDTITYFEYDSLGQPTVLASHWPYSGAPSASPDLEADLWGSTNGPSTVELYTYSNPLLPGEPTSTSMGFSVLWPSADNRLASFGFSCSGCADDPGVTLSFDDGGTCSASTPENCSTLVQKRTETGNTVTNALTKTADNVDRVTEFEYDSEGRLTVTIDPLGRATRTTYYGSSGTDECGSASSVFLDGRVQKVEHCSSYTSGSCSSSWTLLEERGGYNERGQAGCRIDESGTLFTYTYDPAGRLTDTASYADGACSLTTSTSCVVDSDCPGGETCNLGSALLRASEAEYTSNGLLSSRYLYGADGASLAIINTYPTTDPFALCDGLDGTGNAACFSALGELNRLKTTGTGTGEPGTMGFAGHMTRELGYDDQGNVTTSLSKNASGTVRRKSGATYDDEGNLRRRLKYVDTDASVDYAQDMFVDARGRVIGVTDPRFADTASPHDPADQNRTMTYDALGRLKTSSRHDPGGGNALTTSYDYDIHGNLIRVTDPDGRETSYIYDDFGQLVVVDSPDSGITRYQYDLVGNLTERIEGNGRTTTFTYDSRNRLTLEQHTQSGLTAISVQHRYGTSDFDLAGSGLGATSCSGPDFAPSGHKGRLSYTLHEAGGTYYGYNARGEVTEVFEQELGENDPCNFHRTAYAYDGVGRLTQITYPSGRSVEYTYDDGSNDYVHPWSMTVKDASSTTLLTVTDMVHEVNGQLLSFTSGLTTFKADWNAAGEAQSRQYGYNDSPDSKNRFDWDVSSRDGNGNITLAVDALTASPKDLEAEYDNYDRLLNAVGTNLRGYQNCEYSYDGAGNRTTEDCAHGGEGGKGAADGKPIVYTYDAATNNLLDSLSWNDGGAPVCGGGTVSRGYDRDSVGRASTAYLRKYPTAADAVSLTYGAHGRVSSVNAPAGTFLYAYDARNLRKLKDGPGTDTWFVHDRSGSLLAEDTGSTGKEYVWLQGQLIAQIDGATSGLGGTISIIGTDHLGTPMRAWDTTGNTVWAADYEAFGSATEYLPGGGTPSTTISVRYPGQYEDEETGLHYNWWRYYDPNTGRYLAEEPMVRGVPGWPQASYAYAASSPLFYYDLNGLWIVNGTLCVGFCASVSVGTNGSGNSAVRLGIGFGAGGGVSYSETGNLVDIAADPDNDAGGIAVFGEGAVTAPGNDTLSATASACAGLGTEVTDEREWWESRGRESEPVLYFEVPQIDPALSAGARFSYTVGVAADFQFATPWDTFPEHFSPPEN